MAQFTTDISDLLGNLHSSIDSIHRSMHQLSDSSSHDAEIARLEEACEKRVAALRGYHEGLKKQIVEKRRMEDKEIVEARMKEEKEILERRTREDEERKTRVEREEQQREREIREQHEKSEKEREENEKLVVSSAEEEIEKLEGQMRKRWDEGQQRVRELDEKRKEINKKIDEMLSLPAEFPRTQSRRKAKLSSQRGIIWSNWSQTEQQSRYRESMLDRLWNGEKYACERYFQGPLRPDSMLSRLWNGHKYPVHQHFGAPNDPMLDRLWNGETYEVRKSDPMLARLWSGERYGQNTAPQTDPMLRRLWSDATYPREYTSSKHDPMMKRLWSHMRYQQEECISVKNDLMLSRLWSEQRYDRDRDLSHQDDPMLSRLWNGEMYTQDQKLSSKHDPMFDRLWNGENKRQKEIQDPMIERLWAGTRYRGDPMISRLWAAVRYRNDTMLDRLWNGDRYSDNLEGIEEHQDLWVSGTYSSSSPKSKRLLSANTLYYDVKYPGSYVSEILGSSEDEDEATDVVTSSQRHSKVFTAFFDSIRTDIPIVDDFLRNQEYANIPIEDDFDEFVQNPIPYHAPDEQHVHFQDLLPSESSRYDTEEDDEDEEEFPFRNEPTGLRIHTQLPPFEAHFPSSGVPSSPATPSDTESHAFQELHPESNIPDSWSPPRVEVHLKRAMKLNESNPFVGHTGTYTSYMPPRSDVRDESANEEERPGSKGGVGNHFNNIPQNPRSSGDVNALGAAELNEAHYGVRSEGRAAFLGRLSKMAGGLYYGGSGDEKGRLLAEDRGM